MKGFTNNFMNIIVGIALSSRKYTVLFYLDNIYSYNYGKKYIKWINICETPRRVPDI